MSAVENRQLMERVFTGLAAGDSRPLVEHMADDFRWTIAGASRWSRTWDGKQAVTGELFKLLREKIADRVRTRPQRFIADGDYVVVEARGDNVTRAGERYENEYCFVFRIRDGKLQQLTEYADTELMFTALGAP